MRMTRSVCKIEGLQCTAIEIDLLGKKILKTTSMLLRDSEKHENISAGKYTKDRDWSTDVIDKLDELIRVIEQDTMLELFEFGDEDHRIADLDIDPEEQEAKKDAKDGLAYPTIGGKGGTPQL